MTDVKPRTFEQFVYGGDDYDPERGLAPMLVSAMEHAKADPEFDADTDHLRISCRLHERGAVGSSQAWTKFLPLNAPIQDLVERVRAECVSSPGPGFVGQVRLNVYMPSQKNPIKSYTRTMDTAFKAVDATTGESGVVISQSRMFADQLEPTFNVIYRLLDKVAGMLEGQSTMMTANAQIVAGIAEANRPPDPPAPSGSLLGDLGQQVLRLGATQRQRSTGGGGQGGQGGANEPKALPAPPDRRSMPLPPSPVGYTGTTPVVQAAGTGASKPIEVTASTVEQWARSNPDEAEALVLRLMTERGQS